YLFVIMNISQMWFVEFKCCRESSAGDLFNPNLVLSELLPGALENLGEEKGERDITTESIPCLQASRGEQHPFEAGCCSVSPWKRTAENRNSAPPRSRDRLSSLGCESRPHPPSTFQLLSNLSLKTT
ncbi:hypothetical protein KUCAC02_027237, partial [Chaenocephalus aceratus]